MIKKLFSEEMKKFELNLHVAFDNIYGSDGGVSETTTQQSSGGASCVIRRREHLYPPLHGRRNHEIPPGRPRRRHVGLQVHGFLGRRRRRVEEARDQ